MDLHPRRHLGPLAATALLAVLLSGCFADESSATPSPTGPRPDISFEEYAVEFCSAWDALFRAVGNPDSGVGSELSDALDAAVEARDELAAERLAAEITAELESGRQFAAAAGGWAPARPMMAEMDRVFLAFHAMTAAKAAVAAEAPNAIDPQIALQQAGGIEAWTAMLMAAQEMALARPADQVSEPCANVPIAP
jgi:hypothetical protein